MLTRKELKQMAQEFPLFGNGFSTFDIGRFFGMKYKGDNWEVYCDDLISLIVSRAAPLGFQPDPVARGGYRKPMVLLEESKIQKRVDELALEIGRDYADKAPTFVGVLNACAPFMMGLVAALPAATRQYIELDFIQAQSRNGTESTGEVHITKDASTDLQGRDVVIIEGIIGTGLTLNSVIPLIEKKDPRSVQVCTLLNKRSRREYPIPIQYCGFDVPDQFVIGFGLDHNQRFRALPHIAVLPQ
jgi:hypoxanthine phosphoribosyltransferase